MEAASEWLYRAEGRSREVSRTFVFYLIVESRLEPTKRCIRLSSDSSADDDDASDTDDETSSYIIDAKHYGSVSRFYNHSCKPNVHIQNVNLPFRSIARLSEPLSLGVHQYARRSLSSDCALRLPEHSDWRG